jgi:hypothetical protein
MTIELTLTHLITLALAFIGALWALVKIIMVQNDRRMSEKFAVLTAAVSTVGADLRKEAEATRQLEIAFMKFQAELPRDYVRRDDFIRSIGTIEARIDNFALRMERALTTRAEN